MDSRPGPLVVMKETDAVSQMQARTQWVNTVTVP